MKKGMRTMKTKMLLLATGLAVLSAWAGKKQKGPPADWVWYDGKTLPIEGRAFDDTKNYYDRLPASAEGRVTPGVWNLSQMTVSMQFRFTTTAPALWFRWKCRKPMYSTQYMAPVGVCGIDCYKFQDGRWQYMSAGRPEMGKGDEAPHGLHDEALKPGTPWCVNLPLSNGIESFEVAAPSGTVFKALGPRASGIVKPVVFYGVSTTHGYNASRPGLNFVSKLGRTYDIPVVNLGFSGSGKMEPEMVDYVAGIDASLYVLDTIGNMPPKLLNERFEKFTRELHRRRPDVPILISEERFYLERKVSAIPSEGDKILRAIVAKLKAEDPVSWRKLYLLKSEDLVQDYSEMTGDGGHPNDDGLLQYARAWGRAVREALNPDVKPSACLVKSGETVAFLGDSITQFGDNRGGYVDLVMDGFARAGLAVKKIPAGVSGHKSNDMLARLDGVLAKKPDWLTLSCGVNDVGHGERGVPLDAFKTNVTAILDRCAAAGVKVVVMTPTFCRENNWRKEPFNLTLEGYAAFLREIAAARKLPLADCHLAERRYQEAREKDKSLPEMTVDNLHMNGYGNMLMAASVLGAFGFDEAALAACRTCWRTVPTMAPLLNNRNVPHNCISAEEYERLRTKAALKGQTVEQWCLETLRRLGD